MAVGLVGVGRAGAAVGAALAAAGHRIEAVHVRSTSSVLRAARLFPDARPESVAGVAAGADLVLLAVPDDALAAVVGTFVTEGGSRSGLVVGHLAGRYGLAVLEPVLAGGAARLALHPIMTLAGADDDRERLRGAPFGVTADDAAAAVAARIVRAVGGRSVPVPEAGREIYHAALVMAGNYGATLVAAGVDLLARAGVAEPAAALGPLVHAQVSGGLAVGVGAMTGPVRRGDVETIRGHLRSLAALQSPGDGGTTARPTAAELPGAVIDAYRALGLLTAEYLEAEGLVEPGQVQEVVALLSAYPSRTSQQPGESGVVAASRERRNAG
ncbi:MAG: Rossmann-like and DUF2520 domain-containing protein [Frankia sp.]